jgi:hypothetical protein
MKGELHVKRAENKEAGSLFFSGMQLSRSTMNKLLPHVLYKSVKVPASIQYVNKLVQVGH